MAVKQPQGKRRPSSTGGVSRSYSEMYKSAAAGAPVAAAAAPVAKSGETVPAVLKTSDEVDWKGEYGYVLQDLRTLAIVTSGLVLAIIVAGIFL